MIRIRVEEALAASCTAAFHYVSGWRVVALLRCSKIENAEVASRRIRHATPTKSQTTALAEKPPQEQIGDYAG